MPCPEYIKHLGINKKQVLSLWVFAPENSDESKVNNSERGI